MPLQSHAAARPGALSVLPFLFMPARKDDGEWHFNAALQAARAAEEAVCEPRNSRRRFAYLLCEFAAQLGRRTSDPSIALPLSRSDLAHALGISLCRVKRITALLSLSQVASCDGETITVLDWRRLCAIAGYDERRLGRELPEEDEEFAIDAPEEEPDHLHTAAGDPAFFG